MIGRFLCAAALAAAYVDAGHFHAGAEDGSAGTVTGDNAIPDDSGTRIAPSALAYVRGIPSCSDDCAACCPLRTAGENCAPRRRETAHATDTDRDRRRIEPSIRRGIPQ